MIRLYLISAFSERHRCVSLAAHCLAAGMTVTSRWHSSTNTTDPTDDGERLDALTTNLADLERAHVAVALLDTGTPRCALVEVGYALAIGTPVVWVHGLRGRNIADSHPLVVRLDATGGISDTYLFEDIRKAFALRNAADREARTTDPAPMFTPEMENA